MSTRFIHRDLKPANIKAAEWAARGIAQRFLPLVYMLAPLLKPQPQWPALVRLMNLPG